MRRSPVPTVILTGLVTADPPTITGLVTVQEKFMLQPFCPWVITQEGDAGVRVPDMPGAGVGYW